MPPDHRSPDALSEVVLYSAPGCHLCEEALAALTELRGRSRFLLREVDIHSDPDLERRYLLEVPVVTVDGAEVSAGGLDLTAVRGALPPAGLLARLRRLLGGRFTAS